MNALTVEYKRLHSFGNYENEQVGITVLVGIDETPDQALERAKSWVESQLDGVANSRAEHDDLMERKRELNGQINGKQSELDALRARRDRAVELLKANGVNTDQIEEIPF